MDTPNEGMPTPSQPVAVEATPLVTEDPKPNSKKMMYTVLALVAVLLVALVALFLLSRNNAAPVDTTDVDTTSTDTATSTSTPASTSTSTTTSTSTSTTTSTTSETSTGAQTLTVTLDEQNDSGQSGTAVLLEVGSQLQVTLTLTNPVTTPEPAHIHAGSCPNPGAIVFPLTNVVNGTSVTVLDTNLAALEAMGALAINVHKSAAEAQIYFACGDLEF